MIFRFLKFVIFCYLTSKNPISRRNHVQYAYKLRSTAKLYVNSFWYKIFLKIGRFGWFIQNRKFAILGFFHNFDSTSVFAPKIDFFWNTFSALKIDFFEKTNCKKNPTKILAVIFNQNLKKNSICFSTQFFSEKLKCDL